MMMRQLTKLHLTSRPLCSPNVRRIATSTSWKTVQQPTDGVSKEFESLWETVLDAEATGRYASSLENARKCVEIAVRGDRGAVGREHALRMAHHAVGLALLRLGRIEEGARSLDKAREIAVKVSSGGGGDDAYVDVGGTLNDLGVSKALMGDLAGAQKDISRTLYMSERAFRPDDDLVSAACSNLAEILSARGAYEEAIEYAERSVRLTDKMEKLSLMNRQKEAEDGGDEEEVEDAEGEESSSGAAAACPPNARSGVEEAEDESNQEAAAGAIFALPSELLSLHTRNIGRRLNLGRCLIRHHRPEEGAYYIYQALQDSRASGLRLNPVLYAQCLAAVGSTHLSSLLRKGRMTDLSHLAKAGCGPEHEMFFEPQGLFERAVSVIGPILGEAHPETLACRSNLALLLPLDVGVQFIEEITSLASRKREDISNRQEDLSLLSSLIGRSSSLLPVGIDHNRSSMQAMLPRVGPQQSRSQCAALIAAASSLSPTSSSSSASSSSSSSSARRAATASSSLPSSSSSSSPSARAVGIGGGIGEVGGLSPKIIFAINGVLGVGLRGWGGGRKRRTAQA